MSPQNLLQSNRLTHRLRLRRGVDDRLEVAESVGPVLGRVCQRRDEEHGQGRIVGGDRPVARKVLGWHKRCKLAHTFLWGYSYKGLKLVQLLGQLGVCLTCPSRP